MMLGYFTKAGTLIAVAFVMALSVSACGKKSSPKAPSEDSTFPNQYPSEE